MAEKLAYNYQEAGEVLGISASKVQREVKAGRMKSVKLGNPLGSGRVIIPKWAVEEYLLEHAK